jgi:hypothetical protein
MKLEEVVSEREYLIRLPNEELLEEEHWCCFIFKPNIQWRFPVFIDLVTDHTRSRLLLCLMVGFLLISFFSLFFVAAFDFLSNVFQVHSILLRIFPLDHGKPQANQTMAYNIVLNLLNINFGILTVLTMSIFSIPILLGISVWQATKYRILAAFAILWFACMAHSQQFSLRLFSLL